MKFRVAIAVIALAVPAFAQHGGAHAGSVGGRGFSRPSGFSSHPAFSHPAFSQSPGFARPAPLARYGSQYRPMTGAGFRNIGPQSYSGLRNYSSLRSPYNGSSSLRSPYNGNRYNGNRFAAGHPYDPGTASRSRGFDRGRGRNPDRDRFDARRRQFQSWAVNNDPYWPGYGYPYLIDPNAYDLGLKDWDDSEDTASDTSQPGSYQPDQASGSYLPDQAPGSYESDQNGPALLYPPYLNQGYAPPAAQAGTTAPAVPAPAVPTQSLTVIFKNGRAPIEVENYLMTATVLTDLDSEHYEQIPLDQIDLAATKRFNSFAGVDFQVPAASRD